MTITELLNTITEGKNNKPGTYAGVRFDDDTVSKLVEYTIEADIPNAQKHDEFHTTLLYSRKHCEKYKAAGTYDKPMVGTNLKLEIWHPKDKSGNDDTSRSFLVLTFDCPALSARHTKLMEEHKATYDFDEYKPHISLSYDAGDLNIKSLPSITKYLKTVIIESEYQEDLKTCQSDD